MDAGLKLMARKVLKAIFKTLLWIFIAILGLLFLAVVLIYIPPVQRALTSRLATELSASTGYDVSIGRFYMRFPLKLTIEELSVKDSLNNEMLSGGRIHTNVALMPLLRGKIQANTIELNDVSVDYADSLQTMRLTGTMDEFKIKKAVVKLKRKRITVRDVDLSGADITMFLNPSEDEDDEDTPNTEWQFEVGKTTLSSVKFSMISPPSIDSMKVNIEHAGLNMVYVSLYDQVIDVRTVELEKGAYSLLVLPQAETEPKSEGTIGENVIPWTINVSSLALRGNSFDYSVVGAPFSSGIDPNHIKLRDINVVVDSIYNRGSNVAANLMSLSMAERSSGLNVKSLSGNFRMDSAAIAVSDLVFLTPYTLLTADLHADTGLLSKQADAGFDAIVNGTMGWQDIVAAIDLTPAQRNDIRGRRFITNISVNGSLDAINVEKLSAAVDGNIFLSVSGNLYNITSERQRRGSLVFNGDLVGAEFLKSFVGNPALQARIGFPDRVELRGNMDFNGTGFASDFVAIADHGEISVVGNVDTSTKTYSADISMTHFPLYRFLPKDSLGYVTLRLSAEGRGFDPVAVEAKSKVDLLLTEFGFRGYVYDTLTVKASLNDSRFAGHIESMSKDADFTAAIEGSIKPDYIMADISTSVRNLDLTALHLQSDTMAFSVDDLCLSIGASLNGTNDYLLDMSLSQLKFRVGELDDMVRSARLNAEIDNEDLELKFLSEDMLLSLTAYGNLDDLSTRVKTATELLKGQVDSLSFDMEPVCERLPRFTMDLNAGSDNVVSRIVHTKGVKFRNINIRAVSLAADSLNVRGELNSFGYSDIALDTLRFGFRGREHSAEAFVRMANKEGNNDELGLLYLFARIENNDARLSFLQRDRQRNVGFRIGLNGEIFHDRIEARFDPLNPIIASENWSVNEDNYVIYYRDNRILANLLFNGPSKHIYLTTADKEGFPNNINVDIAGLRIGRILDALPDKPPLEGIISANLDLGYQFEGIAANGTLNIDSLSYAGKSPGDIGMRFRYSLDSLQTHTAGMRLNVNGKEAVDVGARISMTEKGRRSRMVIRVPDFPLDLVNIFLPSDTVSVKGSLHGTLDAVVEGGETRFGGKISFTDTEISSPLIGTSFTMAADTINIEQNRLLFDNYRIYSANGQSLHLLGNIDFADLSNPVADMRIVARDFQAINSPRTRGTTIYGRANLNINITAQGALDALTVRGGAHLLSGTDIGFTPQRSFAVRNTQQNIVRFVSFADEESLASAKSTPEIRTRGMDVLLTLEIDEDVRATVNLTSTGSDRLELQGGGTLTYTLNSQGDSRFSGRYDVQGGRVLYNPPLIPQKDFAIDEGGYVEWTGDMLNPSFHISAQQTIRANVMDESDMSRQVDFIVTLNISNTLEDMTLTFDLSAPNDIAIQSQLAALDDEQRFSQAVMLLLNNTYTGPGTTASGSGVGINSSLNAFVENELNNWARNNIRGLDVSFGINSSIDSNTQEEYTDYSYRVSRRFFDDRVTISVGGSISSDQNVSANAQSNLIGDVIVEYRITRRDNMYIKAFRLSTNDMLEGEVVKTGFGFVVRRRMNKLYELFRISTERQERRRIAQLKAEYEQRLEEERQEREAASSDDQTEK